MSSDTFQAVVITRQDRVVLTSNKMQRHKLIISKETKAQDL